MKIVCDLPVNPGDLDLASMDDIKEECARRPLERPCTVLRGWVKKIQCMRCSHCGKVFYEEGEAEALKVKNEAINPHCQDCQYWGLQSDWHGLCRLTGYETSNIARCQKIANPRTQGTSRGQEKE